jgi:photosystem II stability/assembly factor-like uncharacterized protein
MLPTLGRRLFAIGSAVLLVLTGVLAIALPSQATGASSDPVARAVGAVAVGSAVTLPPRAQGRLILDAMGFYDARTGLLAGHRVLPEGDAPRGPMLVATTDGGGHWVSIRPAFRQGASPDLLLRLAPTGPSRWSAIGASDCALPDFGGDIPCRAFALFATTDGGRHFTVTWSSPAPTPMTAFAGLDLAFPTASVGYAVVAGHLLRTADGGRHWEALALPAGVRPVATAWASAWRGLVVGQEACQASNLCRLTVLVSRDGGRSFGRAHVPPWTMLALSARAALGPDGHGVLAAVVGPLTRDPNCVEDCLPKATLVLADTTDGGASWTTIERSPVESTERVGTPLITAGQDEAFIPVGNPRAEIAPLPGGIAEVHLAARPPTVTWSLRTLAVTALAAPSPERLWALGQEFGRSPSFLLGTVDGGAHWEASSLGRQPTVAVDLLPKGLGYGLGAPGDARALLVTRDGGRTWTALGHVPDPIPIGIDFRSPSAGFLIGFDRNRPTLAATRDGGVHWLRVGALPEGVPGNAHVRFFSASEGVVWWTDGTVLAATTTQDGGRHWSAVLRRPLPAGGDVAWATPATVLLLTWEQPSGAPTGAVSLYRSTTAGRSWQRLWRIGGVVAPDRAVTFTDAAHGSVYVDLAVGAGLFRPYLLSTVDGGRHWAVIRLPDGPDLSVAAIARGDAAHLALLTAQGLYVSSDRGRTWVLAGP